MGGSDESPSISGSAKDIQQLRDEIMQQIRQQELDAELSEFLAEQLSSFNDRDTQLTQDRLSMIEEALGEAALDVDRLLFGGSVAKHTYVDGLSDVDALVVLDAADASPNRLVERLRTSLTQ